MREGRNHLIDVGGPQPVSSSEVVGTFEWQTGERFDVKRVPEEALRQPQAAPPLPLQKSLAGLMLDYSGATTSPKPASFGSFQWSSPPSRSTPE